MATLTVNCGSFNKTSYNGTTQYGSLVNFSIPAGATITGCTVSFTTRASGGSTADRAFILNGVRAHSSGSWAQAGALNAYLLQPGNNTFRVTLKSTGGTDACWWDISGITLYITYNEGGGGSAPPVGGGGPVVITPSSIDAGAGNITVTCPAEAGIWHMIDWTFGSYSGSWSHYWETGGTRTISIPLSWIAEMPSATSKTLAIRVRRSTTPAMPYSYATDQTTNVTIKVPASVVPSISNFTATLVPNGVPGTIAGYVQNKSKVALAMTAAGGSYSPITGYSITGGGINSSAASGTFGPFNMSGDVVFTAKVTDARGRAATRQVAIEIMPYSPPAFSSPEAWRSNYDGVKNQKGTYVRLKSGASFSSLEEQNAVTLKGRVYIKGGEAPAWSSMTPGQALILGGGALLFTRTYIAQIQVSDLLGSRITEFIIPTKKTGLSIMAGVSGAAIGKIAETPGILDVAWSIVAPGLAPNPNILHNWDFRNPINQRGLATPSGAGYWLDRWTLNQTAGATYTYNPSWGLHAITTTNNVTMRQYIEYPSAYAGKTVTWSVDIYSASTTAGCTIRLWYNGNTQIGEQLIINNGDTGIKSVTATIPDTGLTDLSVVFSNNPGNDVRIKGVKLEIGTGSTLHLDPPMDHAAELPKCMRFFQRGRTEIAPAITTVRVVGCAFPISLRMTPTVTVYSGNGNVINTVDTYNTTANSILTSGVYGASKTGVMWVDVTGATAGTFYSYRVEASADL